MMRPLALQPRKLFGVFALLILLAVGGYLVFRSWAPDRNAEQTPAARTSSQSSPPASGAAAGTSAKPASPGTGEGTPPEGVTTQPRPVVQSHFLRPLNIAAAALGGRVESVTSESEKADWKASSLIDGGGTSTCAPICAWSPAEKFSFPQEIVLSFFERREATIEAVILDALTPLTQESNYSVPREVEIWTSSTSRTDGFTKVQSATLPPEAREHTIGFAPTRARFVKVRILSNQDLDHVYVGEIVVVEHRGSPSILQDFPPNLAMPALGGSLVSFTSQYSAARRLVDGNPAEEWRSAGNYLPQDFVFAFYQEGEALIERVVLESRADIGSETTLPREVSVAISTESPIDGFEEVGRYKLKATSDEQTLPIGRRARFLRLRILETIGPSDRESHYSRLGEVRIFEGTAPGYQSVLFRPPDPRAPGSAAPSPTPAEDDAGIGSETEPNNSPAEANPLALGAAVRGSIEPLGENDYFNVPFPPGAGNVLTFSLVERPYIRTSLALIDSTGRTVKRFDPTHARAGEETLSWLVAPGDYLVQVTEPPVSMVLIWDTSGSMRGSIEGLKRAVLTYLDQVRPAERLNLIRFSGDVEVLLPEFTGDRERLKKAADKKFDPWGATKFYDAVAKGISLLSNTTGNRAVIAMTDGEDTVSSIPYPEFWTLLRQSGVRLYTIGLGQLGRYSPRIGTTAAGLLTQVAAATNGRSFFAKNSEELAGLYQAISDELRGISTYRLRVTPGLALGTLSVKATGDRIASVAAPTQIELILDASGSMKRRIGGRTMIDSAKAVLADIIDALPDDVQVALRVYGHRIREGRPGACQDSQLLQPFGKLDKARLVSRVNSIAALGTTPIAYSLQEVARDLGRSPGEKLVVLVTDGKEECGGNPAEAVASLQAQGIDVRLNVVGFGLADQALKRELGQLAGKTGGQFVDAKDATALRAAIEQSLALTYTVLDASGAKLHDGVVGQTLELPEGVYTVVVHASEPLTIERVRIAPKQGTDVLLKKDGREIGVSIAAPRTP